MRTITKTALTLTALLPGMLKRWVYTKLFRYKISKTAKIGISFIYCDELVMRDRSRIGHLSVIRDLRSLILEENASIGNLNWVTHSSELSNRWPQGEEKKSNSNGRLVLAAHSAITNRHYLDVQSEVSLGKYTTIAGVRTTILTHSISIYKSRQEIGPVHIGEYCFVGSNTVILPGVMICDKAVVGAGSVICKAISDGPGVYAGCPAKLKKKLTGSEAYFCRSLGYVD